MEFLEGIKSVVRFLTIIPAGTDLEDLSRAAKHMYFFPIVGAFVGFLGGVIGWLGLHALPELVAGMMALGSIIFLSGLHHVDGLLDFGDGIMVRGSPDRRIRAMQDQRVGTGGVTLGLMVLLMTAACIAELSYLYIIPALIVAEASAKFSLVVVASAGRSARSGINTCFIDAMHNAYRGYRFLAALAISLALALILLRFIGLIAVIVGVILALAMVAVANKHFGGITGDVFGATNEIARLVCLATILTMVG